MKNEVKNTKRFWRRGNVLDIAIVLLLVAALVAIGYRYYLADAATDEENMREYRVSFSVENALPSVADSLKIKAEVYFADGTKMGELTLHPAASIGQAVHATAADTLIKDDQGNYVSVTVPDGYREDIFGEMICHAVVDENGAVRIGGETVVTPGQKLTVHTELVTLVITVTSVERK